MSQSSNEKKHVIYKNETLHKRRIKAACIDYLFYSLLSFFFSSFLLDPIEERTTLDILLINNCVNLIIILLEIIIFKASSFGKRKNGLKIKNEKNKNNYIVLYIRRVISYYLVSINFIMLIISNKTICDIIFSSRVVNIDD